MVAIVEEALEERDRGELVGAVKSQPRHQKSGQIKVRL